MRTFASDNYSGVHPRVLEALHAANVAQAPAYGADALTAAAISRMRELLGNPEAQVYFVFNGTAANVLAIRALTPRHGAVICARTAHIHVDECGAPEGNVGCKVHAVETADGKLTRDHIRPFLSDLGNEHHAQPALVSLSQSTELGTVYTVDEIRNVVEFAHAHGLRVHMDGARIANAVASLGCSLQQLVTETGVDALSWGGTKNGLMFGEAVVFARPELASGFPFMRKQSMQLFSKMRFVSAQFLALLEGSLWLQNAAHANCMAALLGERLEGHPSTRPLWPVQANAVFVRLPHGVLARLQQESFFYIWDEQAGVARWMTAWDTEPHEVERFVQLLGELHPA